jgi:hypothetical protein
MLEKFIVNIFLVSDPAVNILSNMNKSDFERARRGIIDCILATGVC